MWPFKMSESSDAPDVSVDVPNYGLKLKLSHKYSEIRTQNYTPSYGMIFDMFPLILRYIWYFIKAKILRRSIVMDYFETVQNQPIYGVPLGGIGCGTIGRGYRGEFCRFQLRPGVYEYNTVDANQFIVTIRNSEGRTVFQSLLSTFPRTKLKSWKNKLNPSQCTYTALYPRSWTEYDLSAYGIKLVCRQISPIIPHNYKDTSLPCAVFAWEVINLCDEQRGVTIAFTFKNGTGNKKQDKKSSCSTKSLSRNNCEGVVLHHTLNETHCAYVLAAKSSENVSVSKCLYFDPNSKGKEVWDQLENNGCFIDGATSDEDDYLFGEMACGIAAQIGDLAAKQSQTIEMSLVWFMPHFFFPKNMRDYTRKYYEEFNSAVSIVEYAFSNYKSWEAAIYKWQQPVLDDDNLPDWFKSALFNETYYISDGGTIWVTPDVEERDSLPPNDIRTKFGKFAYLEGHEYKMYNTYDVHFYASFALAHNWPMLQRSLQYDMKDAIFTEIKDKVKMLYNGRRVERKKIDTVPHDIGDPGEEPFLLLNAYPIHDVSRWRDLNVKFVLQVFRDAFLQNPAEPDISYLTDMYEACYTVMGKAEKFDVDHDGLIENSGRPDQTFDTWVMKGSSAYCGGLWLAALFAMKTIAATLGKEQDEFNYERLLGKGRVSFEKKLWNGAYYNFDCSQNERKSIMADQLCGHWYLRSTGFHYEVFRKERVATALETIYKNNVMKFCQGKMGAVNGFINDDVDKFTIQSLEVWTGVTYALAASMINEGMVNEGFHTAQGMFESMWERFGLAFATPEALYEKKYYRAVAYMRPLSIWSMFIAYNNSKKQR